MARKKARKKIEASREPSRKASREHDASPDDPDDVLDRVFHALADRTRRRLLAHLAERPGTVSELAAPFEMSLPAVSKHIKVLEKAGLITRTVDGRLHRCSLSATPLREVASWLDPYRIFWTDTLDALAHFVEDEEHQGE